MKIRLETDVLIRFYWAFFESDFVEAGSGRPVDQVALWCGWRDRYGMCRGKTVNTHWIQWGRERTKYEARLQPKPGRVIRPRGTVTPLHHYHKVKKNNFHVIGTVKWAKDELLRHITIDCSNLWYFLDGSSARCRNPGPGMYGDSSELWFMPFSGLFTRPVVFADLARLPPGHQRNWQRHREGVVWTHGEYGHLRKATSENHS